MNARLSSAESAGRSGRWAISRACPYRASVAVPTSSGSSSELIRRTSGLRWLSTSRARGALPRSEPRMPAHRSSACSSASARACSCRAARSSRCSAGTDSGWKARSDDVAAQRVEPRARGRQEGRQGQFLGRVDGVQVGGDGVGVQLGDHRARAAPRQRARSARCRRCSRR